MNIILQNSCWLLTLPITKLDFNATSSVTIISCNDEQVDRCSCVLNYYKFEVLNFAVYPWCLHLFIAFTTQKTPVRTHYYLKSSLLFQTSHWKLNQIQGKSSQLWSSYSLKCHQRLQKFSSSQIQHNFINSRKSYHVQEVFFLGQG